MSALLLRVSGIVAALLVNGLYAQHKWEWQYPNPQVSPLEAVTWTGNMAVAVGQIGAVVTSANGETWTARTSGTVLNLNDVANKGGTVVAVGDSGTVLSSQDGVTWVARQSGTKENLSAIAVHASKFIALGLEGVALSSDDGITWAKSSAAAGTLLALASSENLVVATGYQGRICNSKNGIDWTLVDSKISGDFHSVVWTGTQFVAVGTTRFDSPMMVVATSPDGTTWSVRELGITGTITTVTWNGTQLAAFGNGSYFTSKNGVTWTTNVVPGIGFFKGAVVAGEKLIAVGTAGSIAVTTNGEDWNIFPKGRRYSLKSVIWTGKQYIVCGAGGIILRSPDAKDWTTDSVGVIKPITPHLMSLAWSGTTLIAVGTIERYPFSLNGIIMKSSDGITWTEPDTARKEPMQSVTWTGTQFIALAQGRFIYSSPDGDKWEKLELPFEAGLTQVAYLNNKLIGVGGGGSVSISTDGKTWLQKKGGTTRDLHSVTWTGSEYVAVGGNGGKYVVSLSADGNLWSAQEYQRPNYDWLTSVTWTGKKLVAVASSGEVGVSTDGVIWSFARSIAPFSLYNILWANEKFVAIGNLGMVLTSEESTVGILRPRAQYPGFIGVRHSNLFIQGLGSGSVRNPKAIYHDATGRTVSILPIP